MQRTWLGLLAVIVMAGFFTQATPAQTPNYYSQQLQRWYYYPYYYFPHNYWPTMGPKYPEHPWQPYQRPPAYMAYPPFRAPNWRYELFHFKRYYNGNHFWLDQF